MKKKLIILFLALVTVFGLLGCSTSPKEQNNINDHKSTASRIFTDDCGRKVEIPEHISSVVVTGPYAQTILLAIAPDMLAGLATDYDDSKRGIIPDELFEKPFFGQLYGSANLNIEELASVGPELIIDIGEPKEGIADDLDSLVKQTGIPAVYISNTLETMPETFRTLGELLGREKKAAELAQFCQRTYSRTVSIMKKVGEENKVKALYITGEEGLNVLAKTSYHAELLDMLIDNLAVVENPAGKGTGNEVTMDQILLWNPEFIIFAPGSLYSKVKDMDTWDSVTAIAKDNYVETPDLPYNWMGTPPSVQRYLGMIWLTAQLYPQYCDYNVKAEIMDYYKLFYGCELSDEQYQTITANAFLR